MPEAEPSAALEQGRRSFLEWAWQDAHTALTRADVAESLGPNDLELLATAAYMLCRDDEYVSALERAHHLHLDAGATRRAVRCAFWIGINLAVRAEIARATGWFGRAQRLLEREGPDCVEHGYLLIPVLLRELGAGEWEAAAGTAARAAEIAQRFGDADLLALAIHEQGHALMRQGLVDAGLPLLDEAMVAATADELSPVVTGLVYCSVIACCRELYELRRAREWTDALTHWCDQQPDMVAHTGVCQVHRAEILELQGRWQAALDAARRARERAAHGAVNEDTVGRALYREGEVHRLQGDLAAAEAAYREASRYGCEPQPGLARLRLVQGEIEAAAASIRRAVSEAHDPLIRAGLLPAFVEVLLAAGDVDEADGACRELEEISGAHPNAVLGAMSAEARGAVALARDDARSALAALRRALGVWQELGAPYEAARTRVLLGLACRALGDGDTAALELDAARGAFARLGAVPDVNRVDSLVPGRAQSDAHGLTAREREVLRLVATGQSNRQIASALVISEHTVARHLQNIYAKLGVSSRTAAGAFAYEHDLV